MAAVLRLYVRLTRRGIALLAIGVAVYVAVEAISFVQTYPDEASRLRLAEFGDQPAVRMLQGIPHAVETVGGFVVWDGGWFLQAIVGIWACLRRLDCSVVKRTANAQSWWGRRPSAVPALRVPPWPLCLAGCLVAGIAVFATIVVPSEDALGSVLFAVGVTGFGARHGRRHRSGRTVVRHPSASSGGGGRRARSGLRPAHGRQQRRWPGLGDRG